MPMLEWHRKQEEVTQSGTATPQRCTEANTAKPERPGTLHIEKKNRERPREQGMRKAPPLIPGEVK